MNKEKKYIGLVQDERDDYYTIGYSESKDLKKMIDWRNEMLLCGNVIDCKIYELKEIEYGN
jgi:hypothetical protein